VASAHRYHMRVAESALRGFAGHLLSQVQATARVHDRLAREPRSVEIGSFLTELCTDMSLLCDVPAVRLSVDATSIVVTVKQAMPLGMIASELVMNSYKHAFKVRPAGNIHVRLSSGDPGRSILRVADTGDGFPADFSNGGGFKIIEALAQDIDGHVSCNHGLGAVVTVDFSNAAPEASSPLP
jgi:two-component sensor histidine kinase